MDGIQLFALSLGGSLLFLGWFLTAGNRAGIQNSDKGRSGEEAALLQGRLSRRMHMSVALMGLGAAIALGSFLGRERVTTFYWYGVVALATWMCVLAILDGGATWSYVLRARRKLAKRREQILSEAASQVRRTESAVISEESRDVLAPSKHRSN